MVRIQGQPPGPCSIQLHRTDITMNKVMSVRAAALLIAASVALPARTQSFAESDMKEMIVKRIDAEKKGVGIVLGFIDEKGSRIVSHGVMDRASGRAVDGDTVFEIGSATKVFTSLALADMVIHGEVKLDDPISKYLPTTVKVPSRSGREITLGDLASHVSGLPRLPDNLAPKDSANPYADYTVEQMYDFLSHYKLPREIGSKYEYSNLGGGLLGYVLALKAGTNYEALVRQRICQPLGMNDTRITLTPELKARLATGHDVGGKPVSNWDLPTLAGAGALRSTANDMLKFLAANLELTKSELQPAMLLAETPRHDAGSSVMQIALGWHILKKSNADIVWHNGGTGGYHSFVGFDKKHKIGVVVLANSANDIDDIGLKILSGPESGPKQRVAINLATNVFDAYAGEYELTPDVKITMSRKGEHFFTRMTGQDALEVFPESDTEFFLKVVDAQISFVKDDKGAVTHLILHQAGFDQTAKKVK